VRAGPDTGPVSAARSDADQADGEFLLPSDSGTSPGSWEACVGESAGYAVSALAGDWPTGRVSYDAGGKVAGVFIVNRNAGV
jgi:hypothetical protein